MVSIPDYPGPPDFTFRRFRWMMGNALALKCPNCGERPMFIPWRQVRSLRDWFLPLDGCPRCGYPFEREPGYFLMPIFAVNYGAAALLGLAIYLILDFVVRLPIAQVLTLTILPITIFNVWFARHAKAIFLAFDLFFDPYHGDDEGGGRSRGAPPRPKKPDLEPVSKD